MKTIALFYFSGTGNTTLVAQMFQKAFLQQGYGVDLLRMEDVMKQKIPLHLDSYDLIGFGAQVIGYGVPNLVKDFLRRLPAGRGQKTFIFRTAGGVAPINYNVSKSMIAALQKKGYAVFHERLFSIGSNWVVRFSDPVIHQLYAATQEKVNGMCEELIAGKERFYTTGLGLRIKMGIVSFLSGNFFRLTGLDYKVTDACSHCGLCVKNCPADNIFSQNGEVKFKLSCSCCMRCVYNCPKQAIQFRMLKFFPVAGGYDIQKILLQPVSESVDLQKAPPFFSAYTQNQEY